MIVVKVGGSLYDHPGLGPGLRAYLDALGGPVLLVPGGGGMADAVRGLDRTHRLGEDAAHWIALRSLTVAASFLRTLVPRHPVLDAHEFLSRDRGAQGALPASWAVTSDSVAARAAAVGKAERLVLLKSIDVPAGTPWEEAASRGWVDAYFPRAVEAAEFRIEAVNFRRWLDEHSHVIRCG